MHNIQFSRTTKINSYSSRLVHGPFIIFGIMFQRNDLTQYNMNSMLFETLSSFLKSFSL